MGTVVIESQDQEVVAGDAGVEPENPIDRILEEGLQTGFSAALDAIEPRVKAELRRLKDEALTAKDRTIEDLRSRLENALEWRKTVLDAFRLIVEGGASPEQLDAALDNLALVDMGNSEGKIVSPPDSFMLAARIRA